MRQTGNLAANCPVSDGRCRLSESRCRESRYNRCRLASSCIRTWPSWSQGSGILRKLLVESGLRRFIFRSGHMSHDSRPTSALFTQVDITAGAQLTRPRDSQESAEEQVALLRSILAAQDRQNEILEELVNQLSAAQRQRNLELGQWKQANPELARGCRAAAEALSQVQVEFLHGMTREINENVDALMDGEFMLNEFVDRFGPRLAHLNGVLQILAQLSSTANPANS